MVIFYQAAKRRSKYPPLTIDTALNDCFSLEQSSEIIEHKND